MDDPDSMCQWIASQVVPHIIPDLEGKPVRKIFYRDEQRIFEELTTNGGFINARTALDVCKIILRIIAYCNPLVCSLFKPYDGYASMYVTLDDHECLLIGGQSVPQQAE
jgi:hypothetical protein